MNESQAKDTVLNYVVNMIDDEADKARMTVDKQNLLNNLLNARMPQKGGGAGGATMPTKTKGFGRSNS